MTDVLLTPSPHPTLGAMATRLRQMAGHIAREPIANQKALAAKLNVMADDLDWFEDAYQRREAERMKGTS